VAYLLLGVRVYVTDKPYLTVSKSTELQHIITLDAPHSLLRGLLNQSANDAFIRLTATKGGQTAVTVQEAMDALSALWVVNEHLTGQSSDWWRRNLDKEVASLLSQINSNLLAGAAFYKERQRDDLPTTPEFTKACTYLLELMGGWKLDLARTLAHQSLAIFLPSSKDRKGKANQYERLYRLALEILKKMPKVEDPGEMKARIAGAIEKAVVRQEDLNKGARFTGKINCRDDELKDRAYAFAETIVDELFIKRCGRNISKLLDEENSLADGIYYVIDCELGKYWERRRESMKAAFGQNGQEDLSETLIEVE
jgi:CRISPR type I-D-associated protein Csc3/Cas10d